MMSLVAVMVALMRRGVGGGGGSGVVEAGVGWGSRRWVNASSTSRRVVGMLGCGRRGMMAASSRSSRERQDLVLLAGLKTAGKEQGVCVCVCVRVCVCVSGLTVDIGVD